MYDFAYQKPSSLDDAVKALGADADAKALAGGMTLIPVLKQRLNKPSALVDLVKLGLAGVSTNGAIIIIGGMTTHGAVAEERRCEGERFRRWRSWPRTLATRRCGIAGPLAGIDRQQRSGSRLSCRRIGAGRDDQDQPSLYQGG